MAGEAGEAGAPLGSVAADGLGEPDAGLPQSVIGVAAWEVEAGGLLFEQPWVAAQQPPKGELVAGLGVVPEDVCQTGRWGLVAEGAVRAVEVVAREERWQGCCAFG